jgi:hypothetical protein
MGMVNFESGCSGYGRTIPVQVVLLFTLNSEKLACGTHAGEKCQDRGE